MIARHYTNFPDPYRRRRARVIIGGEYSPLATTAIRKTLAARYTVRVADNDLDGYRW